MLFILVGLLFKLTAVPFHMWAPDVYEGCPTCVTCFFSLCPKIAVLAILIKVFTESFYDLFDSWQKILIFSSLFSMSFAVFAAMAQNKIKRLLAFSSIANVGYLLIGICCGTCQGLQALFIYLIFYIIMTINIFAIILSPFKKTKENNNVLHKTPQIKYTYDLVMLSKTNPLLCVTFTIIIFSIAGIPPLAGFYSKAFLFFTAMMSTMYLLCIVGVITSVCSCFYYIRLVKIMYFDTPKNWFSFERIKKENSIVLAITLFFTIFFGVYPTPLYLMSHKFALCILS